MECDDKRKTEFFHIAREMLTGMSNTHPLFFMPYLKHVFRKEFNTLRTNVGNYNRFFNKTIDEHLTSYQEDSPRDFVDIGLKEVFHRQNNVQDGSLPFTSRNL